MMNRLFYTRAGNVAALSGGGSIIRLRDLFTDVDDTALAAHTMTVGSGWTETSGTWDIQGNRGNAISYAGGIAIASANASVANGLATVIGESLAADRNFGLVGRLTDGSNYWLAYYQRGSAFTLYEVNAGAFVQRATTAMAMGGSPHTITLQFSGTAITATLDGGSELTFSSSFNQSATRWGIYADGTASPSTRFDDFSVTG